MLYQICRLLPYERGRAARRQGVILRYDQTGLVLPVLPPWHTTCVKQLRSAASFARACRATDTRIGLIYKYLTASSVARYLPANSPGSPVLLELED